VAEKLLACNTGNEEGEWCNVGATFQSLLSLFIDRFKWELISLGIFLKIPKIFYIEKYLNYL